MKGLLIAILLFLIPMYAFSLEVSGIDGGGNADTLNGQNADFYLDNANSSGVFSNLSVSGNINADGFVHGKKTFALLSEQGLSSFYNLSTTFDLISTFTDYASSSDLTAVNNSVTIGAGADGEFYIMPTVSIDGHSARDITISVFKNATSLIMERTSRLGSGHAHPPSMVNYSGPTVDSGSIADVDFNDGIYLIVNEAAGIANVIDFTFNTTVKEPNAVNFVNFNYDGSGTHSNKLYAFNYAFSRYTAFTNILDNLPHAGGTDAFRFYDRSFRFPDPHRDYTNGGQAKIRIIHPESGTGTHDWYFDKVNLLDNHAGASITFIDTVSLIEGDVITLHIKANEGDTPLTILDGKLAIWEVSD